MNAKNKTLIGLAVFAIVLVVAYFGYNALAEANKPSITTTQSSSQSGQTEGTLTQESSQSEETKETLPAPDFTVYDAQGNEVKFSDFAGKPVVINFWASWCPPCKSEMPHFNKIYAEEKDNVVFMMIDLVDGQRETQAKGQQYIDEMGYEFPIYFDNELDAGNTYGIMSIPTTVFIDASGNIQAGYRGAIDEKTLIAGIELIRG